MNKEKYLEKLSYYLSERSFDQFEIDDIIEDYQLMIDEALENGVLEDELEDHLGSPREIVNQLRKTIVFKRVKSNKLVALSPFISIIIFFGLGFSMGLWHPGWVVFFLIPISGILSSRKRSKLKAFVELMPFVALAVFLFVGIVFKVWRPTWVVFLLIPASHILETKDEYRIWSFLAFITIPIIYVLSFYFFPFRLNWLILLILFFPASYSGVVSVRINGMRQRGMERYFVLIIFLVIITYVILGSIFHIWHPLWLIFLLIPVSSILLSSNHMKQKFSFVAISPFVAVTLFVLFGELFSGYYWSWLFFLIIPMAGILKS